MQHKLAECGNMAAGSTSISKSKICVFVMWAYLCRCLQVDIVNADTCTTYDLEPAVAGFKHLAGDLRQQ